MRLWSCPVLVQVCGYAQTFDVSQHIKLLKEGAWGRQAGCTVGREHSAVIFVGFRIKGGLGRINRLQPPLAVRLHCLAMEAKLYLHLARTLVVIAGLISGVSMYCMWSQTSLFDKVLMFVIFSLMLVICLMISALHEAISWVDWLNCYWEDWLNCYWPDEAPVDLMPDDVPVDPWQRNRVEMRW